MARLRGRSKLILDAAQLRIAVAQEAVDNARTQLGVAEATLRAHKFAYDDLERQLTTPRQPSKPMVGKGRRKKRVVTAINSDLDDAECGFVADGEQCRASKNDPVHDLTYSSSHPFTVQHDTQAVAGGRG